MPYYCTVPRCTSMAGKAKNVSFHQFPRDEELAKLWNRILKRGKPYTKYSKVCSLHFKPEDYTITSVGKNKGQWRTLRKDAVPSQNLPSESPAPYTRRSTGCWVPSQPSLADPLVQQQMAQAIYMQTMLAMQAAGASDSPPTSDHQPTQPSPSGSSLTEIELLLRRDTETPKEVTYKCQECTKCFKDPDVFTLHQRTHTNNTTHTEKENYSTNIQDREDTLRANPILANLLKSSMRLQPENILTVENQIMTALASNMEAYIRTLTSMVASQGSISGDKNRNGSDFEDDDLDGDGNDTKHFEDKNDTGMCVDTENDTMNDEISEHSMDDDKVDDESKRTDGNQSVSIDDTHKSISDNDTRKETCETQNEVENQHEDTSRGENDTIVDEHEDTTRGENDTIVDEHEDTTRGENDTPVDENHVCVSENKITDKVLNNIDDDTNVDKYDTHHHKIEDTRNESFENKNVNEYEIYESDDKINKDLKKELVDNSKLQDNPDCNSVVDNSLKC